jgi:hypothetical protein
MEYREYPFTPSGLPTRPTPTGPVSPRLFSTPPPTRGRFVIDQVAGDSGVDSPQPGDDVEDYGVDAAQSAVGSAQPWTEHPSAETTPTTGDAEPGVQACPLCGAAETDCTDD